LWTSRRTFDTNGAAPAVLAQILGSNYLATIPTSATNSFYPSNNPSGFVSASITNGLAGTNYVTSATAGMVTNNGTGYSLGVHSISGTNSSFLDLDAMTLGNDSGLAALDFGNRELLDGFGYTTVDWLNDQLLIHTYAPSVQIMTLDWGNRILFGTWTATNLTGTFNGDVSDTTNYSADALNNATGHAADFTNGNNSFTGTHSGNGSGLNGVHATNVFYASQFGAKLDANPTSNTGSDDAVAIQSMIDSHTGNVTFVIDGIAGIFTNSITVTNRNNVTFLGAHKGDGFLLLSNANIPLFVAGMTGNNYTVTNLTIDGLTFYGNRFGNSKTNRANWAFFPSTNFFNAVGYSEQWITYVWLSGVNGFRIVNCDFLEAPTYALTLGGHIANGEVGWCKFWWNWTLGNGENNDSVHIFGDADNIIVHDVVTDGNDDRMALNGDESAWAANGGPFPVEGWAARGTNQGTMSNITLKDQTWAGYGPDVGTLGGWPVYRGIRFLAYTTNNNNWTNIEIKNITGVVNSYGGTAIYDVQGSPIHINRLLIDNINLTSYSQWMSGSYDGYAGAGPWGQTIDLSLLNIDDLEISHVTFTGRPNWVSGISPVASMPYILGSAEVKNASISHCVALPYAGITNAVLYRSDTAGAAQNVKITDCYLGGDTTNWLSVVGLAGNGGRLSVSGVFRPPNIPDSVSVVPGNDYYFTNATSLDGSSITLGTDKLFTGKYTFNSSSSSNPTRSILAGGPVESIQYSGYGTWYRMVDSEHNYVIFPDGNSRSFVLRNAENQITEFSVSTEGDGYLRGTVTANGFVGNGNALTNLNSRIIYTNFTTADLVVTFATPFSPTVGTNYTITSQFLSVSFGSVADSLWFDGITTNGFTAHQLGVGVAALTAKFKAVPDYN